jgi:hypothetical protein
MNLPLPRHHRRQQLMKHLIDLLRCEPLHRSGPVQFVANLIEDFAQLARQRDHAFAVHIVDQRKPFDQDAMSSASMARSIACRVSAVLIIGG